MNSLDEIFGEALEREALDTTAAQRAAVADVTVRGARRHRTVRAASRAVGLVAAMGLTLGIGSLVLNGSETPPAVTPTPAPAVPTPAPSGVVTDLKADPRMPQAPAMTPEDWTMVVDQWDVELASLANGGGRAAGSTVAVYFTPPQGTRLLAYSATNFALERPILLSFVASESTGLVYDEATHKVYSLLLPTGTLHEIQVRGEREVWGAYPLGKTPGGDSLYVLETTPSLDGDAIDVHVFRHGQNVAEEFPITGTFTSPVWGTSIITYTADGLYVEDIDSGKSRLIDGTASCDFEVWNLDGTFTAGCGFEPGRTGGHYLVDPVSGDMTLVIPAADVDDFDVAAAILDLTDNNAIDGTRTWSGGATAGTALRPPTVTEAYGETTDLWEDFSTVPDAYAVIFGPRG